LILRAAPFRTIVALETRNSANVAISPDGHWLLYPRREHSGSNLILVENFQ
jgi:hypothetical protein